MQLIPSLLLASLGGLPAPLDNDSYGDPLPAGAEARLGTLRFTHPAELRFASGCGGGEWIVSGDAAGGLRLWRAETGELVRTLDSGSGPAARGAVDPDGERVAVCDTGGGMRILTVPEGALLRSFAGVGFEVAWAPDGNRIAAAGEGTGLTLIALDTESAEPRVLDGGAFPLSVPAFSADGRFVAAIEINRDVQNGRERGIGQDPSCVRVWSVETGELLVTWSLPGELASALVPHAEGGFVIGTGSGHLFAAREIPGVLAELDVRAPGSVLQATAGAKGIWLALGTYGLAQLSEDGLGLFPELACDGVDEIRPGELVLRRSQRLERRVVREADGEWVQAPLLTRHGAPVSALDISADGVLVLTAAHDGILRVWDAASGALAVEAHGHEGMLFGCDLAPDSTRFASVGRDGTARIWTTATGSEELVLGPFARAARDTAFDATGGRLAVAVGDGSAWVFDARTGAEVWHVENLAGPAPSLAWSPDGALLAVAGRGLSLLDGSTGEERWRLDDLGSPAGAVAWSPDGAQIALGLARRAALVVDAEDGERLREFGPLSGRATGVAFAPLGGAGPELLTIANNDRGVRRWDLAEGRALGLLEGHAADPLCLAVALGLPRAASGGTDGLALVWALVR